MATAGLHCTCSTQGRQEQQRGMGKISPPRRVRMYPVIIIQCFWALALRWSVKWSMEVCWSSWWWWWWNVCLRIGMSQRCAPCSSAGARWRRWAVSCLHRSAHGSARQPLSALQPHSSVHAEHRHFAAAALSQPQPASQPAKERSATSCGVVSRPCLVRFSYILHRRRRRRAVRSSGLLLSQWFDDSRLVAGKQFEVCLTVTSVAPSAFSGLLRLDIRPSFVGSWERTSLPDLLRRY